MLISFLIRPQGLPASHFNCHILVVNTTSTTLRMIKKY